MAKSKTKSNALARIVERGGKRFKKRLLKRLSRGRITTYADTHAVLVVTAAQSVKGVVEAYGIIDPVFRAVGPLVAVEGEQKTVMVHPSSLKFVVR